MKICTACNKRYDDGLNFCTSDGTALLDPFEITLGSGPSDEPTGPLQMPSLPIESPGQVQSFGGLERLGPVGKLKKFFFGD